MKFKEFRKIFEQNLAKILTDQNHLFVTDTDKEQSWDMYLGSFPEGTNNIFRERGEFDCSCCRAFIKQFANVVIIKNNKLITIWDFETNNATYQPVINALSFLVKSSKVKDVFVTDHVIFGTDYNHEQIGNSIHTWSHFLAELPVRFVTKSYKSEATITGEFRDSYNVFKRSLEEISTEAIETVLDLISERILYRGEEWEGVLLKFLELSNEYNTLPHDEKDNFCWFTSVNIGGSLSRIRNHSIGVLLQDISNGINVINAVKKYEAIVAPQNYKRPKEIFTTKMIERAEDTIAQMGLLNSLGRRHAKLDDITVNNVIWANKDAEKGMKNLNVFEVLKKEVMVDVKKLKNIKSVDIEDFIDNMLPNLTSIEVLLENKQQSNLISVLTAKVKDSSSLFKWDNTFSWVYDSNVADSMKQRVREAGGSVDGVLRLSLEWRNRNDFDAHCIEPDGNHIYYSNKGREHGSTGILDVDIVHPNFEQVAVENITWSKINKMQEGVYTFYIKNYEHRGGKSGFNAEIEYDGEVYEYNYNNELAYKEKVQVAQFEFSRKNGIKFLSSLPSVNSSKTIWGLRTNQFHSVSVVMFSPNYWDGQGVGNRHYIFTIAGCKNEGEPNGFFNEYLKEEFMENKRVFAALGSKMKVEQVDNQVSGLGFSSTKRNSLIAKVDNQIIRIVF